MKQKLGKWFNHLSSVDFCNYSTKVKEQKIFHQNKFTEAIKSWV